MTKKKEMRSKASIEGSLYQTRYKEKAIGQVLALILEVLLDIREKLYQK